MRKNKQIKEKKITKKERMPCNPLDSSMAEDTFSFTFSGGLNNLGRPEFEQGLAHEMSLASEPGLNQFNLSTDIT